LTQSSISGFGQLEYLTVYSVSVIAQVPTVFKVSSTSNDIEMV